MKILGAFLVCLAGVCTCSAIKYFVVVETGNAGTRDRVSIKIQGPQGITSVHDLYPQNGEFGSRSVKRFHVYDSVNVGEPSAVFVRILSRTSGFDDSWSPRQIIVVNMENRKIKVFAYNNLLPHNTWTRMTLKCPRGFQTTVSGVCRDIDECQNSDACKDKVAKCHNTIGSFSCLCPKGFIKRKYGDGCEDVNECLHGNGPYGNGNCEHRCINTAGSYHCECHSGFRKIGSFQCKDINECTEDTNKCDKASTNCINKNGYYKCNCKRGFQFVDDYMCKRTTCEHPIPQTTGTEVSPPSCLIAKKSKHGDICKTTCKPGWELDDPDVTFQTCDNRQWKPHIVICNRVKCPSLVPPVHGSLYPPSCQSTNSSYESRCSFRCDSTYVLRGKQMVTCQANRQWDMDKSPTCHKNYIKPWISCPANVIVTLSPGASVANVASTLGKPQSNSKNIKLYPRKYENRHVFPAGKTKITFVASNEIGQTANCSLSVTVQDKESPQIIKPCPNNIYVSTPNKTAVKVSWNPPQFHDNVGIPKVTSDKQPGSLFDLDVATTVTYTAKDASGNEVQCSFDVNVTRKNCHKRPEEPVNGVLTCRTVHGDKFCSVQCNPGYQMFRPSFYVSCDRNTETWIPRVPRCVGFIPLPASGKCPSGMQKQHQIFGVTKKYCVNCPRGTKYNASLSECEDCPKGYISTDEASTQCTKCPDGYTTPGTGSKKCVKIPGTFGPFEHSKYNRVTGCVSEVNFQHLSSQRGFECWSEFEPSPHSELCQNEPLGTSVLTDNWECVLSIRDWIGCQKPKKGDRGNVTCYGVINYRVCNVHCEANTTAFSFPPFTICHPEKGNWRFSLSDCVGFVPIPANGKCPEGKEKQVHPKQPEKYCVNCPKGKMYDRKSSKCHDCPVGYISTQEASFQCTKCPDGYLTRKPGSKTCTKRL